MLDAIKSAATSVSNTVSDAAHSVKEGVKDAGMSACLTVAEGEVKKHTGSEIEIVAGEIPDNWKEWMMKTGCNSLCTEDTWDFLEDSEGNRRKRELWKERNIKKIILSVWEEPEPELASWAKCEVEWETGKTECTIWFYPYAKTWKSDNTWVEGGYRRWWVLRDELVFGLQLYQLPGKCFYKSDWLSGFEDVDPDGFLPSSTKKFDRWFQFRHWVMYWYATATWGWNYQWTTSPPKNPDGSLFSLDGVLSLPSMPNLSMPSIKMPSLPDISMPSLPSMPSIEMPSVSAPSLSMPSLSMPSIPEKPKRPSGKYDCHGVMQLNDMKVKASGKKIIFSNVTVIHFYENADKSIRDEKKERQRFELEATTEEQAQSWFLTLRASEVQEGDDGGCCVVA
jgi:hypothetical protein